MKGDSVPANSPKERSEQRRRATREKAAWKLIRAAGRTVVALDPTVQVEKELEQVVEDGRQASERGYFTPDEEERVFVAFGSYLRTRNILYETIQEMDRLIRRKRYPESVRLGAYVAGVSAACLLFRSGNFLVGYKSMKVVSRKLDQGEPRYGIPRKQFTRIYYALTKTYNIYRFHKAVRFLKEHWAEAEALEKVEPRMVPLMELLRRDDPEAMVQKKRLYALNRLGYFRYSLARRWASTLQVLIFKTFEFSGRCINRVRVPFRRKGVTAEIRERALELLRPGDVIATRRNGAMLNYVLPGFWPHVALYIGLADERRGLGVKMDDERWDRSAPPIRVLEARKDGVLFRPLRETLSVDAFVIIRPNLKREELAEALSRAIIHEGKAYNHWVLDFTRGDRVACSELVYRCYHSTGPIEIELKRRFKNISLTTEDILDYAVEGRGFNVVAFFGAKGSPFLEGEEAREALAKSYESAVTRNWKAKGSGSGEGESKDPVAEKSGAEPLPENPLRDVTSALS